MTGSLRAYKSPMRDVDFPYLKNGNFREFFLQYSSDGEEGLSTRHEKVEEGNEYVEILLATEVFAVRSLVYESFTRRRPYDDVEDEAERLFREGVFPGTREEELGEIVRKCCIGSFESVAEIELVL
ncbi:hypothetical protein DM02DRAFT_692940 [Periconia macrospinosa]|uniref:Uncharacterized protein n=1 Tax=Periconia macrospinosa TaxID=97972 RepID=A0A2V1D8V6_9PLEO|nr:hypothetical protein DM02DRAFT_692940 [Periconia macrospinosa]